MDGLHITTNLAQVGFNEWQPLILDIINTVSPTETHQNTNNQDNDIALFPSPERIRGTIGQLDLLGQEWHNVSFNLLDKKKLVVITIQCQGNT